MTFRIYKKFKSMNRFKPIMTFSKLLRNNIIIKKPGYSHLLLWSV